MEPFTVPTVAGPRDLPDLRIWLRHRWREGTVLGDVLPDAGWVRQVLDVADLWWVEPEACDVLGDSAPTWPDDWRLDINDLPSKCGFAILADDLYGSDAQPLTTVGDGTVRISGIMWGPTNVWAGTHYETCVSIGTWSRFPLHDGIPSEDLIKVGPVLGMMTEDMDLISGGEYLAHGDLFAFLGRTDWMIGAGAADELPGNVHTEQQKVSLAEDRRLLAALWAITKTPIVSVENAPIPRPIARRSTRAALDPQVRVLRLGGAPASRQPTVTAGGERGWKHSWIVRPHWRWQAHGPGRAERKLILVGPFRKGPEDAPLLGAERVWTVKAPPRPLGGNP